MCIFGYTGDFTIISVMSNGKKRTLSIWYYLFYLDFSFSSSSLFFSFVLWTI
ncbi:hypothetical protein BJX76DRAFT_315968 [Aspergillus varians]